jgi:hypothetical protein
MYFEDQLPSNEYEAIEIRLERSLIVFLILSIEYNDLSFGEDLFRDEFRT